MESTFENDHGDPTPQSPPQSLKDSHQHWKAFISASSRTEAWSSFKKMLDALPVWAMVVSIVSVITLVANTWVIPVVVTVGCGMTAIYFTVKHAMRQALHEHDSRHR